MYNEVYAPNEYSENSMNNQSYLSIDPDDLYIIDNPSLWDPPDEIVLAYAKKLGFDILNDPPELLSIAKKYLMLPAPENILRSFLKESLEIFYINEKTKEVYQELEIDDLCKAEYEKEKKRLNEEKKKKKKKRKKKRIKIAVIMKKTKKIKKIKYIMKTIK